MSRTDELRGLRKRAAEARERHNRATVEARQGARSLDRAKGPLLDYIEECAAQGREPDPERVSGLEAPIAELLRTVSIRPGYAADPTTGDARLVGVDVVDERAEAALRG